MSLSLRAITARVRRGVTITLATLLILLALVVGIGRELVKGIERFHQPLETWLSKRSALDVHFSRVKGVWTQASPELHLYHVTVTNPDKSDAPPLRIAQLNVRLSLSNTFLSVAPRFRVRAHGVEVHVSKLDGAFTLLGKPLHSQGQKSQKNPLDILRGNPRVSIYDSRLFIDGLYERRTDALVSHLKLFWQDQHAYIDGEALLRGPDEMKVSLKGDLTLTTRKGSEIQGVTYLSLSQGQLARWIPPEMMGRLPVTLSGARGNTELWLHWFHNALLSSTLKFEWRDTQVVAPNQPAYTIDRVAGVAHWQGVFSEFWQLGLRNLTLERNNVKWRPATLQINARHEVAEKRWWYEVALANASFSTGLQPLLTLLPESSALRSSLAEMQPAGRLQDVFVKIRHDQIGWALTQARGELRDYSQKPWQKIPGVQNGGAAFHFDEQTLWVDFDEKDVTLDYPALFRQPLLLTAVQGSLGLQLGENEIRLRSSPFRILSPHGSAYTRVSLALPRNDSSVMPTMALQVTLRNFHAEHASLYLPAGIIPEKLLAWLDGALKAGTLTQGDIVFNGPLRKPEQENARSVLLGFQVSDGQLQFLPEWQEPITHLNGDVIVENNRVEAKAEGGEYYGLALDASRVWTERVEDIIHLHVQTRGQGKAVDGMHLLRESPLGKTLKEPLSDMAVNGPLAVQFELDAPLAPKTPLAGKTQVTLTNGELTWPTQRLEANKLDLALTYDLQKGLDSQKLQATLLKGPVSGRLFQQREGNGRVLRLELKGKTRIETVREWLDIPQLTVAQGGLPYTLQLWIRPAGAKQASLLQINSSLDGVAVELPSPFGKEAAQKRNLEMQLALSGDTRAHRISYGDVASVKWESKAGQWQRGGIHLGGGQPSLSTRQPWLLTGTLPAFRWSDWAPVVDKLTTGNAGGTRTGTSGLALFGDSQLTITHLYVGEDDFGEVPLTLDSDTHYVTVTAAGERLQGRLTLPRTYLESPTERSAETPVSLYLQKLVLAGKPKDDPAETDPLLDLLPPPATIDPHLLPSAHLRIDQLWAGDDDRGRYSMTLKPIPEGIAAENVQFTLKKADFTGTARWVQRGEEAYTYFKGRGVAGNAADVLTGWGYAPSLDSESALLDMDVQWLGAPYQFKLARTQGDLQANLKNGHFLKVSNNAAGRVWGLLNFETWMSRLQLRFSDLSDNEMPYKEIRGRFVLRNNQVQVNRLRIDSAALKMKMDGLVDMSERQINMQWFVTVPVTRNLILPAAVVGGLPGAATAYVIDKMLASQLDKLTTLTYDVKGTFDQPQATLRIPLN